ncbi:MAG: reverse transcriptase domain-containing protein [Solirubrobacteraceae bacterium]
MQYEATVPDVIDRVVQEAVRQVLEPLWEPTFHPSSHGFRPGRSCHTAINEANGHLENGYEWVADLDLEKFFDLVCHQRLTARLAERVGDRRLLVLIGRMLKAKVVLPDGVVIASEQGVPQGGPLSRFCPTSCWTSSTKSSPGVATGSFAMQTMPTRTCVASGRGSG